MPTVKGTSENDVIRDTARNDTLRGKAGDDFLYATKGVDTLYGGPGHDTFVLSEGVFAVLADFNPQEDRIIIDDVETIRLGAGGGPKIASVDDWHIDTTILYWQDAPIAHLTTPPLTLWDV